MAVGDSRSTSSNAWLRELEASLRGADVDMWSGEVVAVGGASVLDVQPVIDDLLAAHPAPPSCPNFALLNLGVNDLGALPAEAVFKAKYAYILDAIHVRWPTARVLCSKFWRRNYGALSATYNGYISDVVADGRTSWSAIGDDESVWLEGGDDGATMSTDGVHYSAAGQTEKAAQMKSAMGY